ncbi:MAG: WYL domain-containing protein [Spirochaetaceae bacterium]|nr:WYL domain-containing protein [Spirochaetaceae bacterium]
MNRLDRVMGMILLLRDGRPVSATELAARFEVSTRTIYRDIEVLSGLGVPVAADMGRAGGFRLREGYFLPPVALGPEEAASLLLGIILTRRLRVLPFPKEAETAERKLLAVLPEATREAMVRAARAIGFEGVPADLLHPEREEPGPRAEAREAAAVGSFLRALLARSRLRLRYRSPYRPAEEPEREIEPLGLVWDRDRWYLVGRPAAEPGAEPRLWRSDRVLALGKGGAMRPTEGAFDVSGLLGRKWLRAAMARWSDEAPVRVALTPAQAERLGRDWYFGNADFSEEEGRIVMRYSEDDFEAVAALVRWLGPGAELLEPAAWRPRLAAGLDRLREAHR